MISACAQCFLVSTVNKHMMSAQKNRVIDESLIVVKTKPVALALPAAPDILLITGMSIAPATASAQSSIVDTASDM